MQLEGFDPKADYNTANLYPTDKRIIARANQTIEKMRKNLENYEVGLAKIHFEEFFWQDFCDTYLEMVKTRVYQPENFENGAVKKLSGQWTLYTAMYSIIRLVSPYIPHVTEEIYQDYYKVVIGDESVHSTDFPTVILEQDDDSIVAWFASILDIVSEVRKYKTSKQLSLGAEISSLTIWTKDLDEAFVESVEDDIVGVTKANEVIYNKENTILIS